MDIELAGQMVLLASNFALFLLLRRLLLVLAIFLFPTIQILSL